MNIHVDYTHKVKCHVKSAFNIVAGQFALFLIFTTDRIRKLSKLVSAHPTLRKSVYYEGGARCLLGINWVIWRENITLIMVIGKQEEGCLAKMLLEEQIIMGWP